MQEIYILLGCLSFLLNLLLLQKVYKFSMLIIDVEDAVEESIESLEKRQEIFNKILEKPVFFDSVEIRQVVNEIKNTKIDLLNIESALVRNMEIESESKPKEENSQEEQVVLRERSTQRDS